MVWKCYYYCYVLKDNPSKNISEKRHYNTLSPEAIAKINVDITSLPARKALAISRERKKKNKNASNQKRKHTWSPSAHHIHYWTVNSATTDAFKSARFTTIFRWKTLLALRAKLHSVWRARKHVSRWKLSPRRVSRFYEWMDM